MADDVDGGEFVVGDFDRSGVRRWIEFATDLEACLARCGDELDDHLMATSGLPRQLPVMNENRRCSILFHLLVPGGK